MVLNILNIYIYNYNRIKTGTWENSALANGLKYCPYFCLYMATNVLFQVCFEDGCGGTLQSTSVISATQEAEAGFVITNSRPAWAT
jgi:hypothetical protein